MKRLSDLERDNEALRQELAAMTDALIEARGVPSHDERISFIVKVPAQRGWHRWTKDYYHTLVEAKEAAGKAAGYHSRARIVERRSFIRERVIETIDAASAIDSPVPQGDAQ